jgi:hypothetical protein
VSGAGDAALAKGIFPVTQNNPINKAKKRANRSKADICAQDALNGDGNDK